MQKSTPKITTKKSTPHKAHDSNTHRDADRHLLLTKFFKTFSEALASEDLITIKKCWAVPSFAMGDTMSMPIITIKDLEVMFTGTKEQYNKRGIKEAIAEIQNIRWLTDKIAIVEVRWPYINDKGHEIGEESSCYTLRLDQQNNFKIYSVAFQGEKKSVTNSIH